MGRIVLFAAVCLLGRRQGIAQVVQLPVIQQFSMSTTVSVPDQGTVVIGGIDRGAEAQSWYGPAWPLLPHSRGLGRSFSSSRAAVSATIIDLDELDRELLGQAPSVATVDPEVLETARRIHTAVRQETSEDRPLTLAQIEQQRANRSSPTQAQAENLFARGRSLLRQGKHSAARSCFRAAWQRGDASLRTRLEPFLTELAAVERAEKARAEKTR